MVGMVHAHTDRKSTIVYNFTRSFNGNGKAGTVFDGFGINGEWERRYHTAVTKDWDGVFDFFCAYTNYPQGQSLFYCLGSEDEILGVRVRYEVGLEHTNFIRNPTGEFAEMVEVNGGEKGGIFYAL